MCEIQFEMYHKPFVERKHRKKIIAKQFHGVCLKLSTRAGPAWEIQPKPFRCERIPSNGMYFCSLNDDENCCNFTWGCTTTGLELLELSPSF